MWIPNSATRADIAQMLAYHGLTGEDTSYISNNEWRNLWWNWENFGRTKPEPDIDDQADYEYEKLRGG
jgi:hypothetical protein